MEGRFGSIGDKIKPGQLPISLPLHGTAGWWTWSVKLNLLYGMSRLGLIADINSLLYIIHNYELTVFNDKAI
jgi:hypothetical protein